jgi:hypothetical protein
VSRHHALNIYVLHTIMHPRVYIPKIRILNSYIPKICIPKIHIPGILMHAKYMHELCSLFMHIPTYYNVIIIIICNDLWGFSINLSYFGYNSTEQEDPVLFIFMFQEPLPELKLT